MGGEGNVGKTRSLLTSTEPKAEERQRAARKKRSVRTVRGTAGEKERKREKKKKREREKDKGKKGAHTATRWAGRDACVRSHAHGVPCFHAYTAILP